MLKESIMDSITTVQVITALIRDIGIIIGIPAVLYVAHKLYRQQLSILKDKNELLKAAQYDNALAYFNSQEILFMKKIEKLNKKISELSHKMKEDSEYMVKYKKVLDETNHEMHMFQVIRKSLTRVIELDALKKLKAKNLDLIVVNNPKTSDTAFGTDTNEVQIINKDGKDKKLPLMSKGEVAKNIFDEINNFSH